MERTVSLQPVIEIVMPYVLTIASVVVTAILGWIASWVKAKFGIEIEAKHRDALHSALLTGLTAAMETAHVKSSKVTREVKSQIMHDAAIYVERAVPDALRHFGLTPDLLGDLLASKMLLLEQRATPAATP